MRWTLAGESQRGVGAGGSNNRFDGMVQGVERRPEHRRRDIVGGRHHGEISEGLSSPNSDCPACDCDCSSQLLFSFSGGLMNATFPDCEKHNPEVSEEMKNNFTDMLFEELKQREVQSVESENKANTMLLEAKRMASQYQKEADKCSSGMETCDEARERSEAVLNKQRRLSAMWELRARQRGWQEGE